jgi:hypothetical protein
VATAASETAPSAKTIFQFMSVPNQSMAMREYSCGWMTTCTGKLSRRVVFAAVLSFGNSCG